VNARHGLVLGKFYPPHTGHHLLIDTAASVCDDVTVLVAAADVESIPVDLRSAWIAEEHRHQPHVHVVTCVDNHPIDYHDPATWDRHMTEFRRALATSPIRIPVDAVFTNEPYGAELARRFGAVAVDTGLVGHARLSASAVRADPVAHWDDIAPAVRAWFAQRVVVIGAESTGTTTISRALCGHYRRHGGPFGLTRWVPEYGRELTLRKLATLRAERQLGGRPAPTMDDLIWTDQDFEDVARTQNRWEDEAARRGGPLLICDTDAWATGFWQERYLGHRTDEVTDLGTRDDRALYLLTHDRGVPFEQDGIRDGQHVRAGMTERFARALEERGVPHLVLDQPTVEERLAQAVAAIDQLVESGWTLGVPLEYGGARPPVPRTPRDPSTTPRSPR
jgi:NadR type nicotinamide-nucleotide adenylyltransferase